MKTPTVFSLLLFFFLLSLSACLTAHKNDTPLVINIINFIRQTDYRIANSDSLLFDAVVKHISPVKKYNFPATFLFQYDALINPEYQKQMKTGLPENCEIGAWWEITQPQVEAAGLHLNFLNYYIS
ncbi:MAG: hypothetical protein LBR97_04860 [Dysgonamonadaceae bacterium]|jgi:hypothetical protein|nr:hypothetical protein [Dysgonamonadaceae bacterium]